MVVKKFYGAWWSSGDATENLSTVVFLHNKKSDLEFIISASKKDEDVIVTKDFVYHSYIIWKILLVPNTKFFPRTSLFVEKWNSYSKEITVKFYVSSIFHRL